MFLGLLSPEISFGEKTATHPARHSAYFAIREAQRRELEEKIQVKNDTYYTIYEPN